MYSMHEKEKALDWTEEQKRKANETADNFLSGKLTGKQIE